MPEIGKFPLDDDELEQVSGGATAYSGCNCTDYVEINSMLPPSCNNCQWNDNGSCPFK